jgi:eukaryotic-like serine/threonine-protein kinase
MPSPKRNQLNSVKTIRNSEKIMHVPGAIVGKRYQIIQKLGREARGKTYLAKDLQATGDSRCAIEQLQPQFNNELGWQVVEQRLTKEVAILERLGDHPQIPQIYGYFVENKQFYLVREYIDGDDLEREVERNIFDEADGIYLIYDVLRILDFIHKTGVVHRDVKPAHLIRRKQDNTFVLINFGAVREIEATEINFQGRSNSAEALNTSGYMAPEQKVGKSSFSSDIYALGKTVIYALSGSSPEQLEQNNPDWPHKYQLSPKFQTILGKMISFEVGDRYRSALEVLYDLKPLIKIKQVVGERYRITRYLGGTSGIETYLADNLRRNYQSPCLIKQIELPDSNPSTKAKIERRFLEELSILERLGYHEQIPQLWDHFEENEEFYVVQEYIPGENLAEKLQRQDISEAQLIQILESTLSVLAFIHQHRIIHRNIKPSNLMIRNVDQQIVLTDFGILADIKTLPNGTLDSSQTKDKKNYLSPEQIAGRPTISSDIYALGMTAIEVLTKTKPGELSRNKQTGELLWQQGIVVNRRLAKIIDKMISLDVGQRYQSAERVLHDLYKINPQSPRPIIQKSILPQTQTQTQTVKTKKKWFQPFHLAVGALGIACLLGSIEFAFPTLRPIYYWYQGKQVLAKQPETALNTFTKAIDLKPNSFLAWLGRANALYSLERYPEALEAYYEAIRLNSEDPQTWKKQGDTLYSLDRFTEAIAAYDSALELQQDDRTIFNHRGKALYKLERYPEALVMQERALATDSLNAQFLSDRAKVLIALERYYDALTVLNRVQAIEPLNLQLWQDKPQALEALERPQEAQRVYQEVIDNYDKLTQEQPENENLWLTKGDFFVASKMYQKAVSTYEQAIQINSSSYWGWFGKGKALFQLGQHNEALAALDKALEIRPESYLAWQARGLVFQNGINDLTKAILQYDQAIAINPNYAPVWRDRGLALNQQGKYSQAIESFSQANKLNGQDLETWLGLATAWTAMGENGNALSSLDRAIEIEPQNPEIWLQKGSILTNNLMYNEACDTYRESQKVTANSPSISEAMAILGCRIE